MLNLHHLRYFSDSVALGSLAAAAEKNRVGRSAVSQAIRALESSLDVELLQHAKNSFEVTTEGLLLARRADEVFSSVDRLQSELKTSPSGAPGSLRIGLSHSLAISMLPDRLLRLLKKHPHAELALQLGNADRVRELLRDRAIDIGIAVTSEDDDLEGLECQPFLTGRFVLISAKKGESNRYLIGDRGPEVLAFRRELGRLEKADKKEVIAVQSWEVIAELTAAGLGVGLVPDFVARRNPRLKTIRAPFPLPGYQLSVLHRQGAYLSRSAQDFIGIVTQAAAEPARGSASARRSPSGPRARSGRSTD